jgi:hypothetical protein
VIMAPSARPRLSEKKVVVVPSRSQQGGLSAVVGAATRARRRANCRRDGRCARHVRTGAVTEGRADDASTGRRASTAGRGRLHRRGDRRVGEPAETLEAILARSRRDAELLTLIAGEGAPLDGDAVTALAPARWRWSILRRAAQLLVADRAVVARAAVREPSRGVAVARRRASASRSRRRRARRRRHDRRWVASRSRPPAVPVRPGTVAAPPSLALACSRLRLIRAAAEDALAASGPPRYPRRARRSARRWT